MPNTPDTVTWAMIEAGKRLATCAFNLSQRAHLTINERLSLDESRQQWDNALAMNQALNTADEGMVERINTIIEDKLFPIFGAGPYEETARLVADDLSTLLARVEPKRVCSVCTATVASFPQGMCCHCQELPWAIEVSLP